MAYLPHYDWCCKFCHLIKCYFIIHLQWTMLRVSKRSAHNADLSCQVLDTAGCHAWLLSSTKLNKVLLLVHTFLCGVFLMFFNMIHTGSHKDKR